VSLRSPLGAVLGHGAARGGVHHWWLQRTTAIAIAPLGLWLLVSMIGLPLGDYAAVCDWVGRGWNPVLLALLIALAAWHSQLGVQMVVEDYVHSRASKTLLLLLSAGAHLLVGAGAVFAVLRIALRSFA
jgi:succinate dehydrogenase / fumarate reductase membrane anchor subunit